MGQHEDEQELQDLLAQAPDRPSFETQCIFCDRMAIEWVAPEEVGLEEFEEIQGPVPVCETCWPLEDDECVQCLVGAYCPDHMTETEWLLARLAGIIASEGEFSEVRGNHRE